ncbi:hypothetical protein BH09ACT5_BH09ACT5_00920 [soil metagenome]
MAKNSAAGAALAGVALAGVLALVGCTPSVPTPMPTPTFSSPTPSPTPTPEVPVLIEGGTAEENKPYFDKVNLEFVAVNGMGSGGSIVQNLASAGFRKQDMQVTADRTAIDLAADSIIVSVRLKGQCLIADFHGGNYTSIVAPLLSSGGCLIGSTVPIG